MYTTKITLFAFFLASALHIESSLNNSNARTKCMYYQAEKDRIKNLEEMFLSGNIEKMSQACKQHVNIHCSNAQGDTALHIAAYKNDHELLRKLLASGLRPWSKNNKGYTYQDILNINMFLSGKKDKIQTALQAKVSIDCSDRYGNTALHLAAYRKDYDQILSLISLGVDPNIENKHKLRCKDILRINQQNGVIDLHKLQDPTEKQKLQESHKTILDILHESMLLNNSLRIDSPRVQSKRKNI